MTWINTSDYGNVTGLASGLKVANEYSGGVFAPLIILAFGVILFVIMVRFAGPGQAFGASALICSFLALLAWAAQVISGGIVIYFLVFGIAGLFFMRYG